MLDKGIKYKKYSLNQCSLYKCSSMKRLANLFMTSLDELHWILQTAKYKEFQVPKKDSEELRTISSPNNELKKAQKRVLRLLQKVQRPSWLNSSEKGKSYVDNGIYHKNCNFCLTVDVRKFYDYCSREYVYVFFKNKLLCAPDIAKYLTDLCTYDGGIKTGTPISQLIAYYAYEDMFQSVYELALKNNLTFSLYVDDMAFSSQEYFSQKYFIYKLRGILHRYGHDIKLGKTKFYNKNDAKYVTGVIIMPTHEVSAPFELKAKVRVANKRLINNCDDLKKTAQQLLGYAGAIKQIEENMFEAEQNRAKKVLSIS